MVERARSCCGHEGDASGNVSRLEQEAGYGQLHSHGTCEAAAGRLRLNTGPARVGWFSPNVMIESPTKTLKRHFGEVNRDLGVWVLSVNTDVYIVS